MRWFQRAELPIGPRGEQAAAKYLKRSRYRILARNLRSRMDEIDILAEAPDRRTIVIVEVKARRVEQVPVGGILPENHVNRDKQRKLAALASQLVQRYK